MSKLNIGQLVKSNTEVYLTNVPATAGIVYTYTFAPFSDFAIKPTNGFISGTTYYIRFKVKRIKDGTYSAMAESPENQLKFDLVLYQSEGVSSATDETAGHEDGSYRTIQTNFIVDPYKQDETNTTISTGGEDVSFEVIFTPDDNYDRLGFILSKTARDFLYGIRDLSKMISLEVEDFDLCIVSNLLGSNNMPSSLKKFGIQVKPGSLICVNGEGMRVGRSGIFEIDNGIDITFLGMAASNGADDVSNIPTFILDYAYTTEGDA